MTMGGLFQRIVVTAETDNAVVRKPRDALFISGRPKLCIARLYMYMLLHRLLVTLAFRDALLKLE